MDSLLLKGNGVMSSSSSSSSSSSNSNNINMNNVDEDWDMSSIENELAEQGEGLFKVDLREYAKQLEQELNELFISSIPDYLSEQNSTSDLYEQITQCDEALEQMQKILQGFQADLGGIGDEIRQLQEDSLSMNVKLKNRKITEGRLRAFVSMMMIPDETIVTICEGNLDLNYITHLKKLHDRMRFARSQELEAGGPIPGEDSKSPLESIEGLSNTNTNTIKLGDDVVDSTTATHSDGTEESTSAASSGFGLVAPCQTAAAREVEPQFERLRLKAVSRIRTFLLDHINDLKRPKTNVQMIQLNVLLKYKYFVAFLGENAPAVAEEVRATYVDTMSKTLLGLFRAYHLSLTKLQLPGPGPNVGLIGGGLIRSYAQLYSGTPNAKKLSAGTLERVAAVSSAAIVASTSASSGGAISKLFGSATGTASSSSANSNNSSSAASINGVDDVTTLHLTLEQRELVMGAADGPPIIVHIAQAENMRYPYETLFRSVQKHLMDSATSEYIFTLDFFGAKGNGLFQKIFLQTIALCLENVESYLHSCNDPVAILLMIRVTQNHQTIMERRRCNVLDDYFKKVSDMLWPQFNKIFQANYRSIASANPKKLLQLGGTGDTQPHWISRQYAVFASEVYSISSSFVVNADKIPKAMDSLRTAFEELIQKLADEQRNRKSSLIFTINNYDAVLSTFSEVRHACSRDDTERFELLLSQQIALYVEEELNEVFGPLIAFVKNVEASENQDTCDVAALGKHAKDFTANWRGGLDVINSSISAFFTSPINARDILCQTLAQLVLYFSRFQYIVKKFDKNLMDILVPTGDIMQQIESMSRV